MKRILLITLMVITPIVAIAQFKTSKNEKAITNQLRNLGSAGQNVVGILGLDPSRLHISHSYQMGYMSTGGQGFSQGVYLNTLTYQFTMPVTIAFQWGMAHQPGAGNGAPFLQNGLFVSGAQLRYQPKENLFIELNYSQNPNSYYYNSYYRNRFGMW